MNKNLLAILFFLPLTIFAQPFIRCGSTEYWKQLQQSDALYSEKQSAVSSLVNEWLNRKEHDVTEQVVTIPVVVHNVYHYGYDSLPVDVIQSQIDAMNKDFTRTNTDANQTPLVWNGIAGNPQFQFCLATRKPDGSSTTGIEWRKSDSSFTSNYDKVKYFSSGGLDAWNPNSYLNIWVCTVGGGVLGLTSPLIYAGTSSDGITVYYKAFGTKGNALQAPYDKGRTATHEIGHYFGLYHIWGDDGGGCSQSDSIADTPNQGDRTFGCPNYPFYDNCTPSFPGIMFMNYMDYTDDACMNMFSRGQALRMQAVLNAVRSSLLTSQGCSPVGINEADLENLISIYPNPSNGKFTFKFSDRFIQNASLKIFNTMGEEVYSEDLKPQTDNLRHIDLNAAAGIYFAQISSGEKQYMQRLVIQ